MCQIKLYPTCLIQHSRHGKLWCFFFAGKKSYLKRKRRTKEHGRSFFYNFLGPGKDIGRPTGELRKLRKFSLNGAIFQRQIIGYVLLGGGREPYHAQHTVSLFGCIFVQILPLWQWSRLLKGGVRMVEELPCHAFYEANDRRDYGSWSLRSFPS